jgi:2-haloalkanoic acid dehalogenase type II
MAKESKFPRAIFYDSKNTLWMWDDIWKDACKDLLKKSDSDIHPAEFWKMWAYLNTGENHRSAFGQFQRFTETLKKSLEITMKVFGLPGDPAADVKFMTDRWIDVPPFPDTIAALSRQKELVKILCYSNVETEYLDMMVDKLGDARPHFVGDMDKSQCCKPSPRAYRWVLETAGRELNMDLNFSNVIYCAGPPWDVQGAMALGMKGCWIRRPTRTTPGTQGVPPDFIVDNLHELTKIVEDCLAKS